ncbi:MAG: hypothetical protein ACI9T9_002809 [Oleiphilaceae bacterium]|jgi:hypothetical protein
MPTVNKLTNASNPLADQLADEIIMVTETLENGYFYLQNRRFEGPFSTGELASIAALEHCKLSIPGECRAIYHGTVQLNALTNLREPLTDMRQINSVECPKVQTLESANEGAA